MKKNWILYLLVAVVVGFTSCDSDDDDAPWLGAYVKVNVKNALGVEKEGVTVYMFKNAVTDDTNTADASKQVVTDANGIASFELNFTELNITDSQTTLYFAVFYTDGDKQWVGGTQGITVKRNETATVDITIPL
ncbi:MAG: hypothetical protein LUG18_10570 [Candidatus Azobacteroides sp.]|nr:hypothetical protein [Candidatus Azobacteroides sp.]